MKSVSVILILLLSQLCTSHDKFKLLVLGDTGQFKEFHDNRQDVSNDSNLFKLDGNKCTKPDGSALLGFEHLEKIINVDYQTLKPNNYMCKADQIIILGDVAYTENKKQINESSPEYQSWLNRLTCMWNVFGDVINETARMECPAGTPTPLQSKTNEKYDNLILLTGNHSFDVNANKEAEYISNLVNNWGIYFDGSIPKDTLPEDAERPQNKEDALKWPSIQIVKKGDLRIEFLDYNPYPMYCYIMAGQGSDKQDKYNNCYYKKKAYGIFPDFDQSKRYTEAFIQAVRSLTKEADWRVLRSHIPIFNVEGTFSESLQFWSLPTYVGTTSTDTTIMDLLKEANINLLLASHNHFGQIQIFPWNKVKQLKDVSFPNGGYDLGDRKATMDVDGTECVETSRELCQNKCYFNDKYFGGYTESFDCDSEKKLEIKYNNKEATNLLMFVVGFSGRTPDPIQNDQKTAATIVFDIGLPESFGGVMLEFDKDEIEAEFFVGGKKRLVFKTDDDNNDKVNYNILEKYTEAKLNNTLGNNTRTFNYSKYNNTGNSAGRVGVNVIMMVALAVLFVLF